MKAETANLLIRDENLSVEDKYVQLNTLFPMHRKSCVFPSPCHMIKVCHEGQLIGLLGGAELKQYDLKIRKPNHPIESESENVLQGV
jgi:hypothetical protein